MKKIKRKTLKNINDDKIVIIKTTIKGRIKKLDIESLTYADKNDFVLVGGSLMNMAALGYRTGSVVVSAIHRTVRNPKDTYLKIKYDGLITVLKNIFEGVKSTFKRVIKRSKQRDPLTVCAVHFSKICQDVEDADVSHLRAVNT